MTVFRVFEDYTHTDIGYVEAENEKQACEIYASQLDHSLRGINFYADEGEDDFDRDDIIRHKPELKLVELHEHQLEPIRVFSIYNL